MQRRERQEGGGRGLLSLAPLIVCVTCLDLWARSLAGGVLARAAQ